ncbi:MAG: chemotaxis protein CheA [Bacteroidales bacterium]|nr:chemotaxis protein CheA [Bacteroidales bacterium]
MKEFKNKFIDEAKELIQDLEKALLALEKNPSDSDIIEKIFRIMHSLKGEGSMFGFETISKFTHNLENVYDLIRNKKIKVNKDILDITLESVDVLRNLLEENKDEKNVNNSIIDINNRIQKIISVNTENNNTKEQQNLSIIEDIEQTEKVKTYYVSFKPKKDILKTGSNPIFLLDDLSALGNCKVFPHFENIPDINTLNPSNCYIYWDIFMASNKGINTIIDVFLFVDNLATIEIHKISDINLFNETSFIGIIKETIKSERKINIDQLTDLTRELEIIFTEKDSKKKRNTGLAKTADSKISSIRVSSQKLDSLINRVSELITIQAHLSLFANQNKNTELEAITEEMEKISRDLRDDIFSIRLIPLETSITRFYRLVRELSNKLKKDIILKTEGTDTELDKNILEGITEPLMHIMRNSIDHGIEDAETRIKAGKPKQSTITLKAFYSGTNIFIQVIDDGAGIDINKIKQSAIAKGFINKNNNLNNQEILNLIFKSGFTTSQAVTDISGRGVGMDVVKQKITEIRGEVDIESTIGKGTTITIKLPLTLSIIEGLLMKIEDTLFIIPISSIEKIYQVEHTKLVNTFNNIVTVNNTQFPFYYLREEFDFPETTLETEQLIIVKYKEKKIGLIVDNVIGEYQAVLKPLGSFFKDNEIISGSSILGDGTVALVLDTSKIIYKFSNYNKKFNSTTV